MSEPLWELLRLDGNVVVTGAAQGFGRAIARRVAEAGATVHLVDRNAEALQTAVDELGLVGSVIAHEADITDEAQIRDLFSTIPSGAPCSLVNNAGVFSNYLIDKMPIAEFERVLRVNVLGTFVMSRELVSRAQDLRSSSIVNIASVDALAASAPGLSHYTTSKHAIAGLTKTLAMELAPRGMRVNAVCPGASMTEGAIALIDEAPTDGIDVADQWAGIVARTPLARLIDPDDVARATVFLLSRMAASVTGALLPVDAGILIQPLEGYAEAQE